jgi:RimJ/RimL family protein N-acetyltransferase
MIAVKSSEFSQLTQFCKMNAQSHVKNHLSIKSLEAHQQEFQSNNVVYLSVFNKSNKLAGYIVLIKEKYENSIQLKRILIDEKFLGIGQDVIMVMENYCIAKLNTKRIWLDVFKNNNKAIYIYEKLGYKVFKRGEENYRAVLFYEKRL